MTKKLYFGRSIIPFPLENNLALNGQIFEAQVFSSCASSSLYSLQLGMHPVELIQPFVQLIPHRDAITFLRPLPMTNNSVRFQ